MFTSSDEVLSFIKKENVEFVDVRFTDLPGQQQHFNVPAATLPEDFFTEGVMFDGSSIRGFAAIHKSDMKLIPDVGTAYVDPFRSSKTLNVNFSIVEPRTGEPYERDPRQVAAKAEEWLRTTGIADTVFFGPEAESMCSTTSASSPRPTRATTTSTRSRAPETPAGSRRVATAAKSPATRAATSPSRRSIITPTCVTR